MVTLGALPTIDVSEQAEKASLPGCGLPRLHEGWLTGQNQHFTRHFARCALPRIPGNCLPGKISILKGVLPLGGGKYKLESKCEEHGPFVESREEHGAIAL